MPETFDATTGEVLAEDVDMKGELGPLFQAVAKAQGEIRGALKDAMNPHFKSKYADLESTWAACREPLSKHGLAIIQSPFTQGENIGLVTILGHSSGAWIKGRIVMRPMKFDAQGAGSVTTYLRRYALASMVGVAPAEDDGEAAVTRPNGNGTAKTTAPRPVEDEQTKEARDDFLKIKRGIQEAKDLFALDQFMDVSRERMDRVKAKSPDAHKQLDDLYTLRRTAMEQAA